MGRNLTERCIVTLRHLSEMSATIWTPTWPFLIKEFYHSVPEEHRAIVPMLTLAYWIFLGVDIFMVAYVPGEQWRISWKNPQGSRQPQPHPCWLLFQLSPQTTVSSEQLQILSRPSASPQKRGKGNQAAGMGLRIYASLLWLNPFCPHSHPHRRGHLTSHLSSTLGQKAEKGTNMYPTASGQVQSFLSTIHSSLLEHRQGRTHWWTVSGPAPSSGQIW